MGICMRRRSFHKKTFELILFIYTKCSFVIWYKTYLNEWLIHRIWQIGITHVVVFINKADVADEEMLELVEMEVRELLTEHGFDGDNTPIVTGSALTCLQVNGVRRGFKRVGEIEAREGEGAYPSKWLYANC